MGCYLIRNVLLFLAAAALPLSAQSPGIGVSSSTSTLTPLFRIDCYGDSFCYGTGAANPETESAAADLGATRPDVPYSNHGAPGYTSDAINYNIFTELQTSPQLPMATLFNGGINDQAEYGSSPAALQNFSLEVNASIARLAIPNQQRTMASDCENAGFWSVFDYPYPSVPQYFYYVGKLMGTIAQNQPLSCVVTAPDITNKVGVNYIVTNGATATFTVTIDGIAQTDAVSGTTVFSTAPPNPFDYEFNELASAVFRQEFTVPAIASHTVVINPATGRGVQIHSVDTITTQPQPNSNYVIAYSALDSQNAPLYVAAMQAQVSQFAADGARVIFADLNNFDPGVNTTTDLATVETAYCDASTTFGHPNAYCGQFHMAQTIANAAAYAGWQLFGTVQPPDLGGYLP